MFSDSPDLCGPMTKIEVDDFSDAVYFNTDTLSISEHLYRLHDWTGEQAAMVTTLRRLVKMGLRSEFYT